MEFQGKTLDQFQVDAANAIDNGESVVVSAPTGSGKTLIAEYAIHKLFAGNQRAIYTAPIKALSNQKFRDFKAQMGADRVGIITGDVVHNERAQVLIMTTEIYRNILFQDPASLHDVRCVVFDEVHYINDIERGTIWEESIIFSPEHIRFCFLSATIPNARQFAAWVESIHNHKVRTIEHHHRPVPLEHFVYESHLGMASWEKAFNFPFDDPKRFRTATGRGGRKRRVYHTASHLEVVTALKKQLPCLFFAFSRAGCEAMALEAAEHFDFTTAAEKAEITDTVNTHLTAYSELEQLASVEKLRGILPRGIAVHHAGMLPALKEVVEILFARGLMRLLYATETFAVGINMPARSVAFHSLRKFDGRTFDYMLRRSYYQMAGRAGRRGMDAKGTVVTLLDINEFDPKRIPHYNVEEAEELASKFDLSYNSVLNLRARFTSERDIRRVLQSNFSQFLLEGVFREQQAELDAAEKELAALPAACPRNHPWSELEHLLRLEEETQRLEDAAARRLGKNRRRTHAQVQKLQALQKKQRCRRCPDYAACRTQAAARLALEGRISELRDAVKESPGVVHFKVYQKKAALLTKLGHLDRGGLTARGKFAALINGYELLATELMFSGIFEKLDAAGCAALACACAYEGRPRVTFSAALPRVLPMAEIKPVLRTLRRLEHECGSFTEMNFEERAAGLAHLWATGSEFVPLTKLTSLSEGDIIQLLRRGVDFLRQVRGAAQGYGEFRTKLAEAMDLLYRDVVVVDL